MAGRGRGMVLPAWMTAGSGSVPGASAALAPAPAPVAAPSSSASNAASNLLRAAVSGGGAPPAASAMAARPAASGAASAPAAAAAAAAPSGAAAWTAHKAPDGRTYYYNASTKVSTYTKPEELKTEAEKALPACDWVEHKSPAGKPYYYSKSLNKSVWEEPQELKDYRAKLAAVAGSGSTASAPAPAPAPAAAAVAPSASSSAPSHASAAPAGIPSISRFTLGGPPAAGAAAPGGAGARPVMPVPPAGLAPPVAPYGMPIPPPFGYPYGMPVPPHGMMPPPYGMMPPPGFPIPPSMPLPPGAVVPGAPPVKPVAPTVAAPGAAAAAGPETPSAASSSAAVAAGGASVASSSATTTTAAAAAAPSSKAKKEKWDAKKIEALTPEERAGLFRELLKDHDVKPGDKWADLQPSLSADARFGALKSIGERKQAFSEFQARRDKEEREERRLKRIAAREGFLALIAARRDVVGGNTLYSEAEKTLAGEPAWKAVEEEGERRDMYDEYVSDLAKREREERRRAMEEKEGAFIALLKSRTPHEVNTSCRWAEVKHTLASDPAYQALDKEDRLRLFKDYILGLEREEESARRAAMDRERQKHRELRADFAKLLRARASAGDITYLTRWGDIKAKILAAPAASGAGDSSNSSGSAEDDYARLHALHNALVAPPPPDTGYDPASGMPNPNASAPSDVFASVYNDVDAAFRNDRRVLRDVIEDARLGYGLADSVQPDSVFEPWLEKMLAADVSVQTRKAQAQRQRARDLERDRKERERQRNRSRSRSRSRASKDNKEEGDAAAVAKSNSEAVEAEKQKEDAEKKMDGEEADDAEPLVVPAGPLAGMHASRPWNLRLLFDDLHARATEARLAEERRLRKLRDRYEELLMDYYYRSDHVGVMWEDAQADLRHRSAYQDCSPDQRREWFESYMERLRAKAAARKARLDAERREREKREDREKDGSSRSSSGSGSAEKDKDKERKHHHSRDRDDGRNDGNEGDADAAAVASGDDQHQQQQPQEEGSGSSSTAAAAASGVAGRKRRRSDSQAEGGDAAAADDERFAHARPTTTARAAANANGNGNGGSLEEGEEPERKGDGHEGPPSRRAKHVEEEDEATDARSR